MILNYQQTIDYLYNSMPMFQREGKSAYKIGFENILALCEALGNPQLKFKSIHIAGTNGKGSSSHYLASILQSANYNVGLFTSPHLKSFTERVKINGVEVSESYIVDFVNTYRQIFEEIKPSFFELTTALAFKYFADQSVDIAVIEVGMGGRLDSTNIITPEVCLITNIGLDHQEYLGDTISKIAFEKAGIIKSNIPVVISEFNKETISVFEAKADNVKTSLIKSFEKYVLKASSLNKGKLNLTIQDITQDSLFIIESELLGFCQLKNIIGVLSVVDVLNSIGFKINSQSINNGFANVIQLTSLKGRWQNLGEQPYVFCDTGHNESGIKLVLEQINSYHFEKLFIILGMVNDKSHENILSLLPKTAFYVFCQASIPRALDANILSDMALKFELNGIVIKDVNDAIKKVESMANKNDFIFIGGSTFVIADIENL